MINHENSPYTVAASEREYRREHPEADEIIKQLKAREKIERGYREIQRFFERFGVRI